MYDGTVKGGLSIPQNLKVMCSTFNMYANYVQRMCRDVAPGRCGSYMEVGSGVLDGIDRCKEETEGTLLS